MNSLIDILPKHIHWNVGRTKLIPTQAVYWWMYKWHSPTQKICGECKRNLLETKVTIKCCCSVAASVTDHLLKDLNLAFINWETSLKKKTRREIPSGSVTGHFDYKQYLHISLYRASCLWPIHLQWLSGARWVCG